MGADQEVEVGCLLAAVFLRGQDVDLPQAQLRRDGVVNVDIEIESDAHSRVHQTRPFAFNFSQMVEDNVNEAVSGIKSELSIKIFGPEPQALQALADRIADVIKKVPGAVDVGADELLGQPQVQITVDRSAIARYGLSVSGGTLSLLLSQNASACVPDAVLSSTLRTATLFAAGTPDSTLIYKFIATGGGYDIDDYIDTVGWDHGGCITMNPGEGVFI